MQTLTKTVLALSIALTSAAALAAVELPKADPSWESMSSKEELIQVYRKEVPGSDVVAFRGETKIEGNIAKVANVLYDTSRKTEWVAKIVSAKDVRNISEQERIEYNHTASGFFLVRDRDFVFHAKATIDQPNQRMILTLKSVKDDLAPETDRVRGEIESGTYILTSIDGGKNTHVMVELKVDPKGSIPKWLVNMFQKSWPKTTLENIQKQVRKPDVTELAAVRKYILDSQPMPGAAPTATPAAAPAAKPAEETKKI